MLKPGCKRFSVILYFSLVFICLTFAVTETKAAVFTVTNLNDSGAGSLRQAITDAGNMPGENVINFQVGVTGMINLEAALPSLSTVNGKLNDFDFIAEP